MAKTATATAVLPPHAIGVAMKTLVATTIVGAQTTVNNQLKAVTAMAIETETMTETTMTMKTKAMAWQQQQQRRRRKRGRRLGAAASLAAAAAATWQERGIGGNGSATVG